MLKRVLFRVVLEDAVVREENAYRFYEAAASAAHLAEGAARLLRRLCAEELRHRVKLEDLQVLGELPEPELEIADLQELGAVERPEGGWPVLNGASSPEQILQVALRKELEAVRYYDVLSRRAPLRGVRGVFRGLRGEEQRHVRWVRQWLAELDADDGAAQ